MQAALLKSTRLARAPCASLNKGARSPRHCVVNRRRLTELHVLAAVSLSCFTRTRTVRVAELVALVRSLTAGRCKSHVERQRVDMLIHSRLKNAAAVECAVLAGLRFLSRASLARATSALLNLLHFSSLSQLA